MAEETGRREGGETDAAMLAELARCTGLGERSTWAARWACRLSGADAGGVFMLDPVRSALLCTGASGEAAARSLRRSVPSNSGLARDVLRDRATRVVRTDEAGAREDPLVLAVSAGAAAVCVSPLLLERGAAGVVALGLREPPSRDRLAALERFLRHAAAAVETARDTDRKAAGMLQAIERLTSLFDLSKAFGSTIDLAELDTLIVQKAADFCACETASLWFLEGDGDVVLAATAVNPNYDVAAPPVSVGAAIVAEVLANTDAPLRLNALPEDDPIRTADPAYPVTSLLAVPLVEDETPIGALVLANKRGRHPEFSDGDEELLVDLARQAVRALHNARQYEAEKKVAELDALLTVSREITSTLDLDKVMHAIVNSTGALVRYDRCAIGIQDRGRLRLGAVSGILELDRSRPDLKRTAEILEWVYGSGGDVSVVENEDGALETERAETTEKFRIFFAEGKLKSFHGILLKDEEGPLGVLGFESSERLVFDEETRSLLQILVNQATVAVRNAQLYRQVPLVGFLQPLLARKKRLLGVPRSRRVAWGVGALGLLVVLFLVPWRFRLTGSARVFPARRASVTAGVDGVVARVLKLEGDSVKAGEVVAVLENETYAAAAAAARSAYDIAEADLSRFRAAGDAAGAFEAESHRKELAARIALEDERLARTRLVSPVSGVIVTPRVQERVGQNLTRGAELCVVADTTTMVAEVAIAEEDAARLQRAAGRDQAQHVSGPHVLRLRRARRRARARGEQGPLRRGRGRGRKSGRPPEDRHAGPGQGPRRLEQHRDARPETPRPLALREALAGPAVSAAAGPRPALAAERGAALLAERHGTRGEKPALKKNLIARPQVQMGETRIMVKDPDRTKYYVFADYEWRLIELYDGTRTRPGIAADYNARYPFDPVDEALVLDYEEMLRKIDLIEQSGAERGLQLLAHAKEARMRAAEEKAEGFNPFFLLFNVLDPEEFLKKTVRYVRWIWTPPVVVAWSLAVLWTIGIFILHWEPIFAGTYELYAFLRKPLIDAIHFFFILSFLGFFHEYGHAYAVKIYGGEVHDIGIALLYFTPAFYCDTTDALLFENKWHRLWVNTAGIYVEGFVCAAATALWVVSYPDTLLHELAYKTMLFTGISTIFFNVNPLVKIDGYHALTSLLEMPDLREESFRYIGLVFQKHVLRLNVQVPVTTRRRRRI